jgi:hypothetical protein
MSSQAYNLQVLIYDPTLNFSRWSTLSLMVAADNTVTGTLEYTNPMTQLTGRRIPGTQDDYELEGGGAEDSMKVSIRMSSYPAFGSQLPVAGVATINEQGPYYIIGKLSQ